METKIKKEKGWQANRVYLPEHNDTTDGKHLERLVHSKTTYRRMPDGSLRKVILSE